MQSLNWVDITYIKKHKSDNPADLRDLYYPNLRANERSYSSRPLMKNSKAFTFAHKYIRRASLSIILFSLSYIPVIGKFVLPLASFYAFHKAVGLGAAALIFSTGVFLPREHLILFLQSYYSSRNLMRELLEPYFARIKFTPEEKRKWFMSREGVLFGFSFGFYVILKVPLFGVLIYGIAEASTAYLITKITDPPPHPAQMREFAMGQQEWHNKHEFLSLKLANIDNMRSRATAETAAEREDKTGI